MSNAQILVVEDDPLTRGSLQQKLARAGHAVECVASPREGLQHLAQRGADLVLLDVRRPGLPGLEVLSQMRRLDSELPIIIITAHSTIESAVQAVKEGAYDYLPKPLDFDMLLVKVEKALETANLKKYVRQVHAERRGRYTFNKVIAESPKMKQTLALAQRVAESKDVTVLILGETGTGKDLLARVIHFEGPRRDQPFLVLNCAAIPESLLESELFGYEKGAFTDAATAKPGLFELAQGGTIFLNEIGDLSLNLQAKLLQVIEEKSFRRVGGTRSEEVDVRILAATNKNLSEAVEQNQFRKDLYYRLQVFPLHLAPLRERREDIMPLAHLFLAQFNEELPKHIRGFTDSFEACALYAAWPGNARELRNVVERAMILCQEGDLISPDLLPPIIGEPAEDLDWASAIRLPPEGIDLKLVEKELIRQALHRAGGHQGKAAKLLRMGPDAFRYRMGKHGYLSSSQATVSQVPSGGPWSVREA